MNSENTTGAVATPLSLGLQFQPSQQLKKLTPNEIIQKIDQLRPESEPIPSFIEQLLFPVRRDYARVIEETKISAIKVKKNSIEELGDCINIYIQAHKDELKIRTVDLITETFDCIMLHLAQVNEKVISGYYDVFLEFVAGIREKKKLSREMRQAAIESAKQRLKARIGQSEKSINSILDNLRDEVIRFNCEIGQC